MAGTLWRDSAGNEIQYVETGCKAALAERVPGIARDLADIALPRNKEAGFLECLAYGGGSQCLRLCARSGGAFHGLSRRIRKTRCRSHTDVALIELAARKDEGIRDEFHA